LERAKKYAKNNYLLYYDQARLYCKLNDYDKALGVLNDYLKIDSEKQSLFYLKGLIYDIQNKKRFSNY
jgi:tetratricopeptide (TPR) repeat protein